VGITAGSKACLADALHSSSNIVTAFAIFISRKLTGKPQDDDHPYGHGKVEFIAAGAVSVVIILLTVVLVVTSLEHIIYRPVPPPHLTAGLVALASIIVNELLFRYFRCVGTELRSQTIVANAWANRVVGSRFGFHHLDPIAALVVAAIIVKVCIGCIRDSVAGLMDRSVPAETEELIKKIVNSVDEVRGIRYMRARLLGDKIWIDLGIRVSSGHTVNECQAIGERTRRSILESIAGIGEVQVDYEPAED
jgi:cation diffusion facilitator family transporter